MVYRTSKTWLLFPFQKIVWHSMNITISDMQSKLCILNGKYWKWNEFHFRYLMSNGFVYIAHGYEMHVYYIWSAFVALLRENNENTCLLNLNGFSLNWMQSRTFWSIDFWMKIEIYATWNSYSNRYANFNFSVDTIFDIDFAIGHPFREFNESSNLSLCHLFISKFPMKEQSFNLSK